MYPAPRISWGIFFLLFFLLGIIPGIVYLIVKGNEVSRFYEMRVATQRQMPPPPAPEENKLPPTE